MNYVKNTLLLFSRLYNESIYKFNDFINSLIEEENVEALTLVNFEQQKNYYLNKIKIFKILHTSVSLTIST